MYAGVVLTLVATVAPFVDRATSAVLADHIRDGYPSYTHAQVDAAVTMWLVILSVVGALGITSWAAMIWAVRAGRSWAPWAAGAMFVLGTAVALSALLAEDTSGDTGLAPLLGWIGVLPCVAGAVAVAMLWRRGRPDRAPASGYSMPRSSSMNATTGESGGSTSSRQR
jgi:hypothetical protein